MGQSLWGRPVLEKGTPVNEGNQPLRDNGEGLAFGLPLTHCQRVAPGVSRRKPGSGVCTFFTGKMPVPQTSGTGLRPGIDIASPIRIRHRNYELGYLASVLDLAVPPEVIRQDVSHANNYRKQQDSHWMGIA